MTLSKWIPVTEQLPDHEVDVLCCDSKGVQYVAQIFYFTDGTFSWHAGDGSYGGDCTVNDPTAWQKLLAPYQSAQDEINNAIKKTEEHFKK